MMFFLVHFRWLALVQTVLICWNISTVSPACLDWTVNHGASHIVAWPSTKIYLNTTASHTQSSALLVYIWICLVDTWSFMWIECEYFLGDSRISCWKLWIYWFDKQKQTCLLPQSSGHCFPEYTSRQKSVCNGLFNIGQVIGAANKHNVLQRQSTISLHESHHKVSAATRSMWRKNTLSL